MNSGTESDEEYIAAQLENLVHHWGTGYIFQCPQMGAWHAYRRDDMTMITAPDPERLLELVRGNYLASPVPRQGEQ
ncbi:MAG: hypothetical protein ACRDPY_46925, partial [Streptosporangiaceae bacterium]